MSPSTPEDNHHHRTYHLTHHMDTPTSQLMHGFGKSLPNLRQDIPSDDLIETIYQFHQRQQESDQDDLTGNNGEEEEEDDIENDQNFGATKLNSDDIIVPVSTNDQPNLQYPPQFSDSNTATNFVNMMNSKLPRQNQNQQQQHQQQQQQQQVQYSMGPFDFSTLTNSSNIMGSTIPESFSTSTISSYESIPPTLTHSITNSFSTNSSQLSPQQQQQQHQQQQQQQQHHLQTLQMTPARATRKASFSTTHTPLQVQNVVPPLQQSQQQQQQQAQYQTPLRKTPSITPRSRKTHQRSRSRLSVDANGSAAVIPASVSASNTSTLKSPGGGGVNPFYTPTSFASPKGNADMLLESPAHTPFATPLHPAGGGGSHNTSFENGVSPYQLWKANENTMPPFVGKHKRFKSTDNANDMAFKMGFADTISATTTTTAALRSAKKINSNTARLQPGEFLTKSKSSINISTKLEPPAIEIHSADAAIQQQHHHQHQHQQSIPQNLYSQFDKLNFIPPEIQNQPYAPLMQFNNHHHHHHNEPEPELEQHLQQQQQQQQQQAVPTVVVENNNNTKDKKAKVHECHLCGSRFQRPEHVKRHMRSHSSDKPFMCVICNKRFNRNDNMKAHERKIHGIDSGNKKSTAASAESSSSTTLLVPQPPSAT